VIVDLQIDDWTSLVPDLEYGVVHGHDGAS
jgi:hypothetical protein